MILRVHARSSAGFADLEDFLIPATVSRKRRMELAGALLRAEDAGSDHADLVIYEAGLAVPPGAFEFDPRNPQQLVRDIIREHEELGLPLARLFPPFYKAVTEKVIFDVSKENAMFVVMTAMPSLMPGVSLPWAIPEAISDASVLTVNQIRMAFLLAAASDRTVGYREQKAEIGSIIAGAIGLRALARELVSKVPFGGGIIPKAAIAFAGTFVEGMSLERLYRVGHGFSRSEKKIAYVEALARGRDVARDIWEAAKRKRGAREVASKEAPPKVETRRG